MKKDEKPPTFGFLMVVLGFIIFGLFVIIKIDPIDKVIGVFGNRSDAKEYCAKQHDVINAKTDFAAKKAYKACISNY